MIGYYICRIQLFFISLCLLNRFQVIFGDDFPDPKKCPPWLDSYIEWHNNVSRSDILLDQAKMMRYEVHTSGSGLGDKMRTALWSLRVAAASHRLLMIDMSYPLPLERALEPNKINWLVRKKFENNCVRTAASINLDLADPNSANCIIFSGQEFPFVQAPLDNVFPRGYDPVYNVSASLYSVHSHCLFDALFKPSSALNAAVDNEIKALFGDGMTTYAAAHLRSGHLTGENNVIDPKVFGDPLENLLGSLYCMREMKMPHVIVASSRAIRAAARFNFFNNASGTRIVEAVHTQARVSENEHFSTFIELGVLARAKCLIMTRSGYARLAFFWGGQNDCVKWIGPSYIEDQRYGDPPDSPQVECYKEFSDHFKDSQLPPSVRRRRLMQTHLRVNANANANANQTMHT